jgi:glycosyltransferase involved in cell wall biosynthesis
LAGSVNCLNCPPENYGPEFRYRQTVGFIEMAERWMAVLGWRDEPTDALEDYCKFLARALAVHDIQLQTTRVRWADLGWNKALVELTQQVARSKVTWVLIQYTALGWSRRGFPVQLLRVCRAATKPGVRCAIVFHDSAGYEGSRLVDRIRRATQLFVMRRLASRADATILTVHAENISWLPRNAQNTVFIPVGANLPEPEKAWQTAQKKRNAKLTVAVFSLSTDQVGEKETKRIADAVRFASEKLGPVRVSILGRNSEFGGKNLQDLLTGTMVEVVIHGLVDAEEVVRILGESDAMLFVRGPVSSRRGSALAGISCGLPLVATAGWETATPITDSGVVLVPESSPEGLGPALLEVLQNDALRASLREKNQRTHAKHFSWEAIAAKFAAALEKPSGRQRKSHEWFLGKS